MTSKKIDAAPEPVTELDFNTVECALSDARNMAGILHRMLDKLEPMPSGLLKGVHKLLLLNKGERNLLCFAAWKTLRNIEEAEEELDKQLYRLSPPQGEAAI